ncbi:hypothetical protein E3U43_021371 [Larimichthys crocea]|uniref:Uncharacterized protein n=1 Tax=Larimichthys crocea TaxID=215358 RepID=A0ACD3R648_LARCR|nr:hypothetical protein E3U43_021371 [Larimichthys crocea]
MRRAATWCPKPKGRAEVILCLQSQAGMPGTLSPLTVRAAAAASAVQSMRLGAAASQCAVGPCSPLSSGDSSELGGPTNPVSYLQINRILKHAHFQSLHSRGHLRDT